MIDPGGMEWMLLKIHHLEERAKTNPAWWPTHRNIWQGSYDVWYTEQDRIDSVEIPKARMQAALDDGLIKSEIKKIYKYDQVVYSLTELGKKTIEKYV